VFNSFIWTNKLKKLWVNQKKNLVANELDISFDKWKEFEKKWMKIIDIFFFGENCIFFKEKSEI